MTVCFPNAFLVIAPGARGKIAAGPYGMSLGIFRLPTDPLFFSDLTLENVAPGSRYRVSLQSDPSVVLSLGTAAATTVIISGVPCYSNPQLLELTVRNASGSTRYLPFTGFAYQDRDGASFFVSQVENEINA